MRCSICLSEMKQGPYGLECVACGTMLEPVEDETGALVRPQSKLKWRLGVFVGLALVAALTVWAIFALAPGQSADVQDELVERAPLGLQQIVLEDENAVTIQARSVLTDGDTLELIIEKGCQSLPGEGAERVQWVNLSGDPLTEIRPSFPGNWQMHQICPMDSGGAMFATLLDAGVAISRVEANGETRWTQLVTVANPSRNSVELLFDGQFVLLVSHDEAAGLIQITAFDDAGEQRWRQSIEAGPSIEQLHSARTSLGDMLTAWKDPTMDLRLIVVSPLGGILLQGALADRPMPVQSVIQDELGQTLIIYGEDQSVVELISRTNSSAWQRQLDPAAQPIGAISYDANFLVFAAVDDQVKIWGLDPLGSKADVLNLRLFDTVLSGQVHHVNSAEAVLSLKLEGAEVVYLVLDLRGLEDALRFDLAGPVEEFVFANEARVKAELDRVEIEQIETAPSEASDDIVPIELDLPTNAAAADLEATPLESIEAGPVLRSDENDRARSFDLEPSTERPSAPAEVLPTETVPAEARCMFSCVSTDGSAVEYVLMQIVDINDGESLNDVSLRLNEAHENLCRLSGGEPVTGYTRECNPG